MTAPEGPRHPMHFRFQGEAASVAVAGTFNHWVGDAAPLAQREPGQWETTLAVAPGRHHYKLVIDGRDWIVDPSNPWISEDAQNNSSFTMNEDGSVLVRPGAVTRQSPSVLHQRHGALASPAWLRDAVIYQLSVRAFGRTFDGVRERLDYLQELGVNAVWMMPIHPVGVQRRIGELGDPYAVRDFMAIDPALGDAASLRALVDAMHARGMRVLFDWTLNRASCDNVLLAQHPEWFTRDAAGTPNYLVPNRDYFCGFDFSSRPLRDWLLEAMAYWVGQFGFDGMRFDDSDITPTDFLDEIRAALQAVNPSIALISQSTDEYHHVRACDLTYDGGVRDLVARIARGDATAQDLAREWEEAAYSFPRGALRMRWLEEKEQGRAFRHFGAAVHRAAASVLLTMDGVPHILMGQEFNEPRWTDWRWLFDDVALDWPAADAPTLAHYQALTALRRQHPELRSAGVDFIDGGAAQMLAYWRGDLLVMVNLAPQPLALPQAAAGCAIVHAMGLNAGMLSSCGLVLARRNGTGT